MHLRETETGAFANRLGGKERVEHLGDDIGRDAYASILDFNDNVIALSDTVVDLRIARSDGN
jgi:hypothetical protein